MGPVTVPPASDLGCGNFAVPGIRVHPEPMLRIHGYSEPGQAAPGIRAAAARMAARAEQLFQMDLSYRMLKINRCDEHALTLETGTILQCGKSGSNLMDCTMAVAFFLTAGEELDKEAARLHAAGGILEVLFLESAGWLGIEAATKSFANYLRDWAPPHGYALGARLAPGYGSWPLTDQKPLLSLFDPFSLSVRLLESCAMVPKMSRSGLYGLRLRPPTKAESRSG